MKYTVVVEVGTEQFKLEFPDSELATSVMGIMQTCQVGGPEIKTHLELNLKKHEDKKKEDN